MNLKNNLTIEQALRGLLKRAKKIKSRDSRNRALWAVVTALRGPDDNTTEIKRLTTCRIRGVMNLTGVYFLASRSPVNTSTRDAELKKSLFHFAKHYRDAVRAIRALYGYDLKDEQKVDLRSRQKLFTPSY